jgi:hypothetical protein
MSWKWHVGDSLHWNLPKPAAKCQPGGQTPEVPGMPDRQDRTRTCLLATQTNQTNRYKIAVIVSIDNTIQNIRNNAQLNVYILSQGCILQVATHQFIHDAPYTWVVAPIPAILGLT